MPGSILGSAVRRREDPRLITGRGQYVDDLPSEHGLHAVFVRSHLAHARITSVDAEAARALPGVVAVYTAADLGLLPMRSFPVMPEAFARAPLADGVVRFAGEQVAVAIAETRAQAADAAAAVAVELEDLPVVVDAEAGLAEGAPVLFPEHGSNLAFEAAAGDGADGLDGADVVVRQRFRNQRLAAVPIEPNAIYAEPDGDGLKVWVSTQAPFKVRDFIAEVVGLPEQKVRVIAPDVGGGFGAKLPVYHEHAVVAAAALRLQRPVRWIETRSENFMAMTQGRAQIQDVEIGAARDGRLSGLRARVIADVGAYPGLGAFLPYLTGQMVSGVYAIPHIDFSARCVATNTTPIDAYRGAGRPEATALIERAMDLLAAELAMDPAELRRRNLIPADAFPYTTASNATYDSGDYRAALDEALRLAGYEELRAEQDRRRSAGDRRLLGVGISCYIEITAVGSPTEFGSVEIRPDGTALVLCGTTSTGQGHLTSYAQIVAATLGLPMEAVEVVESDTARLPRGDGTAGSRSMQLGGSAVLEAARAVLERARHQAADLLEADPADVVTADGGLAVAGAPGSVVTWSRLAAAAGGSLSESSDFVSPDTTYPFGAHVSVVEVDAETGEVHLLRHIAVDDCGTQINPLLVEGQVQGGIAQGIAQALFEEVLYDQDGNLLTGSLIDYGVPSAAEFPVFETASTQTPTPLNPLGAKGVGEAGTIGSTPAVQNAVIDALSHLGVRHLDMPLTPEKVWRAANGGKT
jgi:carbon-monoxide dehydrogenase large subunit